MQTFNKLFNICAIVFVLSVLSISAHPSDNFFSSRADVSPSVNFFDLKDQGFNAAFDFDVNSFNDDRLIGSWEIKYRINDICDATMIFTFEEDGNYSTAASCDDGSFSLRAVGSWSSVKQGIINVKISDYEPKYGAMGKPIKYALVQTMKYKFMNNDRVIIDGRAYNRSE